MLSGMLHTRKVKINEKRDEHECITIQQRTIFSNATDTYLHAVILISKREHRT